MVHENILISAARIFLVDKENKNNDLIQQLWCMFRTVPRMHVYSTDRKQAAAHLVSTIISASAAPHSCVVLSWTCIEDWHGREDIVEKSRYFDFFVFFWFSFFIRIFRWTISLKKIWKRHDMMYEINIYFFLFSILSSHFDLVESDV